MLCWICMHQTGSDDHFCENHRRAFGPDRSKNPKRKDFTDRQIRDAVKRQDGLCGICHKPEDSERGFFEAHHKNGNNQDNSDENCQMIHAGCHSYLHRKKTRKKYHDSDDDDYDDDDYDDDDGDDRPAWVKNTLDQMDDLSRIG